MYVSHTQFRGTLAMRFPFRIIPPILLILGLFTIQPGVAVEPSLGIIWGNLKSSSGGPLHDALVNIVKVAKQDEVLAVSGIRSNKSGFFRAANLVPGEYYLQIEREGYRSVKTERFNVAPDRPTSFNITLQGIINYISNEDDPDNWNLKTVMRSSSDRRMIFRYLPSSVQSSEGERAAPFYRNGSMSLASSTSLGNNQYLSRPQTSQNGVVTNFALSEPFSRRSRMILSGQFDAGRNTFWRMRDTIHYRPDESHDYKVSFGYGRMNVNDLGNDSQLASEEQDSRESRIQTIALGIEGTTKFYNLMEINYGIDYSHLRFRNNRIFVNPSLRIVLSPSDGWRFTTAFTSRRESGMNSVVLSDGEVFNLTEPTLITVVGDNVSMSQVRHSEIEAEKTITPNTNVGVAIYRDDTYGPGIPLMVTMITPGNQKSTIVNLDENNARQHGLRVNLNHRMGPNLSGSLGYVYGEAMNISDVDASLSVDSLNTEFQAYAIQRYHHSITGQLDAFIPETNTHLLATIRWYPGNPVSTIDWFSDPMDIGSKSLNFEIRQDIPVHNLFLTTGRWEILLDFRNVLNQGEEVISASDGVLVLNRSPRSLRFGLNLNFH